MERKVNEIFNLDDIKLKVVPTSNRCLGCFFNSFMGCDGLMYITGPCRNRSDNTDVIFKLVEDV